MYQSLNTLYVLQQGAYLHLERETLKLDVDKKTVRRIPMHHIDSVVLFGNVLVSPFAIHRLAADGTSLVFMSAYGRFMARVQGPQSGNVLLRREQHLMVDDMSRTVQVAKYFLAGKIRNCRSLLLRGARETDNEENSDSLRQTTRTLADHLRALERADNLDTMRGIEGQAAKIYFEALNLLILRNKEGFNLAGRNRRPPRDPVNALLSFLYAMLSNLCISALEACGLDPQIGYLHTLRPGRPSLALDLMEEFRSPFADRLVLALINRQQVQPEDFETRPGGSVMMSDKARKAVLTEWQQRNQREVLHEVLGHKIPLGLVPAIQARLLARYIRGESNEYPPYLPR